MNLTVFSSIIASWKILYFLSVKSTFTVNVTNPYNAMAFLKRVGCDVKLVEIVVSG